MFPCVLVEVSDGLGVGLEGDLVLVDAEGDCEGVLARTDEFAV